MKCAYPFTPRKSPPKKGSPHGSFSHHAPPLSPDYPRAHRDRRGPALRLYVLLFDADPGYFSAGILPTLSNIMYFVTVAAAVICAALTPKDHLPTELHVPHRAPVAILLGVSLAVFTVVSLLIWFPARKSDVMIAPAGAQDED